jgi:hypothetical protein
MSVISATNADGCGSLDCSGKSVTDWVNEELVEAAIGASCEQMRKTGERVQVRDRDAEEPPPGCYRSVGASREQEHQLGDRVQVRDRDTEVWSFGRVTGVAPLKVLVDGHSRSYTFGQVVPRQCPKISPSASVDISALESTPTCGECIACCDAKADACFMPCGHVVVCVQCVPWIEPARCPLCRQTFVEFYQVVDRSSNSCEDIS